MNSGSPLSFPVCSNKIIKVGEIQRDFVGVFNKTIIPLALVGYEMIIIIPRGRVGYEMRELAIDGVSAIALPCRGTIDRRNADILLT